jgi:hypothetical protein
MTDRSIPTTFRTPVLRTPVLRTPVLRTPVLRAPVLAAAVALSLLAVAPAAEACSCAPPGDPRAELEHADAVFSGRVVEVEPGEQERGFRRLAVRFALDAVWKGLPEGDEATVRTAEHGAACGYSFEPGEEYLVYAYAIESGELTTGLCTRNAPRSRATDDLAALGEPARAVTKDDQVREAGAARP